MCVTLEVTASPFYTLWNFDPLPQWYTLCNEDDMCIFAIYTKFPFHWYILSPYYDVSWWRKTGINSWSDGLVYLHPRPLQCRKLRKTLRGTLPFISGRVSANQNTVFLLQKVMTPWGVGYHLPQCIPSVGYHLLYSGISPSHNASLQWDIRYITTVAHS